ncbi:hypothetical protein AC1031_011640 [Aphanomyces cochlioides]|nr:hypothetical protein AC1031_011640 [Aphanomyces cochlioides]
MAETPKAKHRLSQAEKMMVVRVHAYFINEAAKQTSQKKKRVWSLVAQACGISESTVSVIVASYNRCGDPTQFMSETLQQNTSSKRESKYTDSIVTVLRELVYTRNKAVQPITAKLLALDLREK